MCNEHIIVSVICAAYNHEPYIAQALESFVNQKTDFKYEVIVNDDASTDDTARIIKEYQSRYPEIIKPIFQKVNLYSRGININNIMIRESKGKYIATCEGDDYWIDNYKLQKQVNYMENNPNCSLCGHANIIVDSRGKFIRNRSDCPPDSIVNLINDGGYMHYATRLARREVFTTFPDVLEKKFYRGVSFIYYAHTLGYLYYMKDTMSAWRINPTSVTHTSYIDISAKKSIVYDYIRFFDNFNQYTNFVFKDGVLKRKLEQICYLVSTCRDYLQRDDLKYILQMTEFHSLPYKYRIYIHLLYLLRRAKK